MKSLASALLFVSLPFASVASAGIITYDFTGLPGDQVSTPVTTSLANITASDITRGIGITPNTGLNSMTAGGWSTGGINLDDYFSVQLSPDLGFLLNLTSLTFSEQRNPFGIRNIEVRTSLDGFAASIFALNVPDDANVRRSTVDLSGATFQGLTAPIEFRLYGHSAENAVTGRWRLGVAGANPGQIPANLQFDATASADASIPEPATFLMGALGLIAAGMLRRKS